MPKGLSLHLGIDDYCDPPCGIQDLHGAVFDARAMQDLAERAGFTAAAKMHGYNTDGTSLHLLTTIRDAATKLDDGDYFVLTFDGYGLSFTLNAPSPIKRQGWLLADGAFFFDDLWRALRVFETGVRVLVVSNSCHSGTIEEARDRAEVIREIPQSAVDELLAKNMVRAQLASIGAAWPEHSPTIIHIAACARYEQVPDAYPPNHTPFNMAFRKLVTDGTRRSFDEFVRALRLEPSMKTPGKENITLANTAFEQTGPFVLA